MSTIPFRVAGPTRISSAEIDSADVSAVLRRLWVTPKPTPARFDVPRDKLNALAKTTLDTMLVRAYRVTPLPPAEEYAELLARVRYWVQRGKPVHIMLGYAPMKNPKTAGHTHADWAEFFALAHLAQWHNKVCEVYPPGLRIKIIFDDSTIRMANRHKKAPMSDYMTSVAGLIRAMGYQSFLVGTMRQSSFAWLFHFGLYQWAEWRLRRWERDPANQEIVDQMFEFAQRNVETPPGLSEREREQYFRDAAHRYRVYWEALQLSRLSRLGHKIVAMYLDGHQHHLRQRAALHLTSLGKGQVVQPWQGEGALQDNGCGQLIPTVLTEKRRGELEIREFDVREVICHAGFAIISVGARNSLPESAQPHGKGGHIHNWDVTDGKNGTAYAVED
jgi:pyoverdine/dityrosine biosynthesis protein